MVDFNNTTYSVSKNGINGQISVSTNVPGVYDVAKTYTFNPDGSATSRTCWGVTTKCPVGAFSDALLKLPNADKLNEQNGKELVAKFNKYVKDNNIKYEIPGCKLNSKG